MQGMKVLLFVDSEPVEGALVKGYSARSDMCLLTGMFWRLAHKWDIKIKVVHVSGEDLVQPDLLSREWVTIEPAQRLTERAFESACAAGKEPTHFVGKEREHVPREVREARMAEVEKRLRPRVDWFNPDYAATGGVLQMIAEKQREAGGAYLTMVVVPYRPNCRWWSLTLCGPSARCSCMAAKYC